MLELLPYGDSAVLVLVGDAIDAATHARVRAVCDALDREPLAGVSDIVPGYTGVAVHYSPPAVTRTSVDAYDMMVAALRARLHDLRITPPTPGKLVEVPVRYGGADGPDLDDVARHCGLTPDEVVRLHTAGEYIVYMVGFSPGFPFLAGLPPQLEIPRRETPRLAVPAGSVAIGGRQTGIYPIETPGGWHIIGRTTLPLFLPEQQPPTLLQLDDRVRFVAVDRT